ncbi:MAG TPA: Crp/Fnr family transcriptional regulator [Terriglobales bacterium]|nr:Crp/Fnr family transcriptional regulator [Terriglobales bacterium]
MSQDSMSNRFWFVPKDRGGVVRRGYTMRAPYGLEIIESCFNCPHREERLFCNLSTPALKQLETITAAASYPKGATLFVEGQKPRGVFILCNGRVKLSTSSADGKTLILRVPEKGEILGLAATVSGQPYQASAEVLEPAQANFIARNDFLEFLKSYGEAALRVAQQLSENYHLAINEMRTIGLSHSAAEKFARFLLEQASEGRKEEGEVRLTLTLTHEEIAQMIGSSRETVTRLFSDFKKRQLLQVKGSSVLIQDIASLRRFADS